MPNITALDRPTEDPDNRAVIFLGGPWDMTMRRVPMQWGLTVRVPYPTSPVSIFDVADNGPRIFDYTLSYMVIHNQLVCIATSGQPTLYDESQAVVVIMKYARKGMMADG